jgi:ribonuclease E
MAGLVVIDFIDMEQSSHNRKVEKAMKDAVKNDRARIQIGRISSFGLMEMSRQRLRTGVLEASTRACPHCEGTGLMRTAASAGLAALRIIEDEAARGRGDRIVLRAGREAAVYVLNKKRTELADIESRYGVSIEIAIDETFEGARMTVDSSGPRPVPGERAVAPPTPVEDEEDEEIEAALVGAEEAEEIEDREEERASERGDRPGRRRRRRRGGRGRGRRDEESAQTREPEAETEAQPAEQPEQAEEAAAESRPKRRRRGRKGAAARDEGPVEADSSPMVERPLAEEPPIAEVEAEEKPKTRRRKKAEPKVAEADVAPAEPVEAEAPKPKRARKGSKAAKAEQAVEPVPVPPANNDTASADDDGSEPRSGWWQRTFG